MEPIDSDGVPYHYYNLDPDPQLPPPYNPPAQPNNRKMFTTLALVAVSIVLALTAAIGAFVTRDTKPKYFSQVKYDALVTVFESKTESEQVEICETMTDLSPDETLLFVSEYADDLTEAQTLRDTVMKFAEDYC